MRVLYMVLALFPTLVMADDIPLTSHVSAVTMYPAGATVTREVPFSIEAGHHDLILTDMPRDTPLETVRVSVEGATMGSITVRDDFVPPREQATDAAFRDAKAKVERLEQELRDGMAGVEAIRLESKAAAARVAFLEKLGEGDAVEQLGVAALRDLIDMIGSETLSANKAALSARMRADEAELGLQDLRDELKKARQALKVLVPETEARAMLAVSVSGQAAADGVATITYTIRDAGWQPVYDVKLDRASGMVAFDRGAFIRQNSGENWEDIALTLSTVRPSERMTPGEIAPWLRRITDPVEIEEGTGMQLFTGGATGLSGEIMPAPMAAEADAMAAAAYDGLAVTYSYPESVSIASGADHLRIALGQLSTEAELVARAVPLVDKTAYLVARIKNDMGELILPGQMMQYLDGRYIGLGQLALIPAGGEVDLGFGPIEGLLLTRTVVDRNEGDRGLITKSNEISEDVLIKVENLTAEPWTIQLRDRVPYAEQEDLEISWEAKPRPDTQDVKGMRGILEWKFGLLAHASKLITLNHILQWPEGKILR